MNIQYKVSENCSVGAEIQTSADMKKLFAVIANAQEIFTQDKCGNCGSKNVRFVYKTPQGYQYYLIKCQDCKHELKISEQKPENGGRLYANQVWEPPYTKDDGGQQPQYGQEPVYQYGPEGSYQPAPPMRQPQQQAPARQPAPANNFPF